jgi:hypothetical protein
VTNLCRDEVTAILKDKIEAVWGGSFNVNGLGGVLTCGVTGFKAGLSHAPVCAVSALAAAWCAVCCVVAWRAWPCGALGQTRAGAVLDAPHAGALPTRAPCAHASCTAGRDAGLWP